MCVLRVVSHSSHLFAFMLSSLAGHRTLTTPQPLRQYPRDSGSGLRWWRRSPGGHPLVGCLLLLSLQWKASDRAAAGLLACALGRAVGVAALLRVVHAVAGLLPWRKAARVRLPSSSLPVRVVHWGRGDLEVTDGEAVTLRVLGAWPGRTA